MSNFKLGEQFQLSKSLLKLLVLSLWLLSTDLVTFRKIDHIKMQSIKKKITRK